MRKGIKKTILTIAAFTFLSSCGVGLALQSNFAEADATYASSANQASAPIEMVSGASIYVNPTDSSRSGIKFAYTISDVREDCSYNMMIVPYAYLGMAGIEAGSTDVDYRAKLIEQFTEEKILTAKNLTPVRQADGSYLCEVGFVKILTKNYNKKFIGIGYIEDSAGARTYPAIEEFNGRDVTYVASMVLEDSDSGFEGEQKTTLRNYVYTGINNAMGNASDGAVTTKPEITYSVTGASSGTVGDSIPLSISLKNGETELNEVELYAKWTSSNPSAAKVSADGNVFLVKSSGTPITITASSAGGEYTATHTITVNEPAERTLKITGAPTGVWYKQAGAVINLDYKNTPAREEVEVEWTSSDASVATVSEKGVVTQKGAGETTITATIKGTQVSDSVKLTVAEETTLKIELNNMSTEVDYGLRCITDGAAGFLQSWLTATEDGLHFDTKGAPITTPIIRLTLPEPLKAATHYEIQYTMKVSSASVSSFTFMTGKQKIGDTSGDWYRIFNTTNLTWTKDQEIIVHGTFTSAEATLPNGTAYNDLNLVDLLIWNDKSNANWSGDILFDNIKINEVTEETVELSISNAATISEMTFEAGKQFTIGRSITYKSSNNTLPGGRQAVYESSNPEVIKHVGDEKFEMVSVGTATLSFGIYGVKNAKAEVTVTLKAPQTVSVTFNGEAKQAKPMLTAAAKNWSRTDFTSYVTTDGSKIVIDGTNVENPSDWAYRCIKLVLQIPGITFDTSKTYSISYKVTATNLPLGGNATQTAFKVGGSGAESDISGANGKTMSGTANICAENIENGMLYVFDEVNQLLLKDLKLTVEEIAISEVSSSVGITVCGETKQATPTLTAANDNNWSNTDFTSCVTMNGGKITIDGSNVENPNTTNVYRCIDLLVALPDGTFDTSKTYTISYKVNIKEATLKNGATAVDFRVGGKIQESNDSNKVDLYSKIGQGEQSVSGKLCFNNGKAYIFQEANMMCLKGLKMEISDVVITVQE